MNKKIIILLIGILIVFMIFMFSKSNKKITTKVIDNTTGDTYYQIYREDGSVIRNVTDKASIKMYMDNPDFIGPKINSNTPEESVWETPEIIE